MGHFCHLLVFSSFLVVSVTSRNPLAQQCRWDVANISTSASSFQLLLSVMNSFCPAGPLFNNIECNNSAALGASYMNTVASHATSCTVDCCDASPGNPCVVPSCVGSCKVLQNFAYDVMGAAEQISGGCSNSTNPNDQSRCQGMLSEIAALYQSVQNYVAKVMGYC